MKRQITFAILLISSTFTFAQGKTEEFDKEIIFLKDRVNLINSESSKLKSELSNLNFELINAIKSIDSLRTQTQENSNAISQNAKALDIKIKQTGAKNEDKITEVQYSLSKNSLYGIIGVLLAILFSGILYWLIIKKQKTHKTDVEAQLSKAKKSIEEEQVEINTKLAELYNGQMELLKEERKIKIPGDGVDHSLALKVADEIVKMQMNLIHMDNKIRGHKQLSIAVANVFDNFKANGYEIIDLLNKPFNDGMNMDVSKEPDPSMQDGEQKIVRIIKPEIHFKNKMIQKAQVIVAYGE